MSIIKARITSRCRAFLDRINRMARIIRATYAATSGKSEAILHNSVNPVSPSNNATPGQVIGLAMKVHRTLGQGFLDSVYQKALLYELAKAGFKVESDKPIQVRYESVIVGDFKADLIVNE